jgi:hypothetical protein
VEVLTYCIMWNHFHVLVQVPCLDSVCDAEAVAKVKLFERRTPDVEYRASNGASAEQLEPSNNRPTGTAVCVWILVWLVSGRAVHQNPS